MLLDQEAEVGQGAVDDLAALRPEPLAKREGRLDRARLPPPLPVELQRARPSVYGPRPPGDLQRRQLPPLPDHKFCSTLAVHRLCSSKTAGAPPWRPGPPSL